MDVAAPLRCLPQYASTFYQCANHSTAEIYGREAAQDRTAHQRIGASTLYPCCECMIGAIADWPIHSFVRMYRDSSKSYNDIKIIRIGNTDLKSFVSQIIADDDKDPKRA